MSRNVKAMRTMTTFMLRSFSMRETTSACPAAFLTSPMERFRPAPRFLRIRYSVNPAPTSMPPTAMGRMMNFQTLVTMSIQLTSAAATPGP